jgi:hypothetical protein
LDQFPALGGDIYVTWGVRPDKNNPVHWYTWMKPSWNAHAFQPEPQGGTDCGVAKIASDGSRVLWATYLGGSDYDSIEASIRVDEHAYVYVGCQTRSTDIPTTQGAFDRTPNGGVDWYVAKLLPDGSDIVYGTFIGDEGDNWLNTHNLVLFGQTGSADFPVSNDAYQSVKGARGDAVMVKLSPNLDRLVYSTFLGASGNDAGRAGSIDNGGGLIVAGASSGGWPTKNAHQQESKGPGDAIVAKLSSSTGTGSKP